MGVAKYTKEQRGAISEVELHSGIKAKTSYGLQDLERVGFDYQQDLGDLGQYPFTRSRHP